MRASGRTDGQSLTAPVSLWRPILDPEFSIPAAWRDQPPAEDASRLADLVTPALAAHFLRPVEERLGLGLLDAATVQQSRLFNRFNGGVQRRWMKEIAETDIPVVFLKGFAFAHSLYPDPDIRTIGDIDILVRERDLKSLAEFLTGQEFRFDPLPLPPWGFISDASFMPLVSADGDCNIDLHVQPDCYPAYRSLTAEDVFRKASVCEIDGIEVSIPSLEHAMVLCLTNAAKDKFGVFSVRKILDIIGLLSLPQRIDWKGLAAIASEGHFLKPAGVVFSLLYALGLPPGTVPAALSRPPTGLAKAPFARLVSDYASMFENPPSALRVLERELSLCTEADVALHNAGLRLKGLFRRRRGIPEGFSVP